MKNEEKLRKLLDFIGDAATKSILQKLDEIKIVLTNLSKPKEIDFSPVLEAIKNIRIPKLPEIKIPEIKDYLPQVDYTEKINELYILISDLVSAVKDNRIDSKELESIKEDINSLRQKRMGASAYLDWREYNTSDGSLSGALNSNNQTYTCQARLKTNSINVYYNGVRQNVAQYTIGINSNGYTTITFKTIQPSQTDEVSVWGAI